MIKSIYTDKMYIILYKIEIYMHCMNYVPFVLLFVSHTYLTYYFKSVIIKRFI